MNRVVLTVDCMQPVEELTREQLITMVKWLEQRISDLHAQHMGKDTTQ